MAQTTPDTTLLPDSSGQEVKQQAVVREGGEVAVVGVKNVEDRPASTPSVAVADPHAEKTSTQTPADPRPKTPPPRPSLVPLGSTPSQSATLTPVAPHPKRFNPLNINKKFLEKTASGSSASSSSPSVTKSGSSAAARPSSIQPTSSHSRLVTTKLTANLAVASSTAGWSRPSSVAPSPATVAPSSNSTSPLPTAPAPQPSTTTSAPQLPHAGKIILPQPRAPVAPVSSLPKDSGSSKPVWGNLKPPTAVPLRPDIQPNDFPTAAEVAHVARKQAKIDDAKATSDTAAKQLRMEEADTFRGVHLDPNAHHWDEMEEDDDNFLGGVIEFGDGRQYKIESSEPQPAGDSPSETDSRPRVGVSMERASVPVSKEDRFVDDFDRSWPKSRNSPTSASREFPSPSAHTASPILSPVISNPTHSPQDSSRVLFNERSNRLEPYSQSHRASQGPFGSKRLSFHERSAVTDPRGSREGPHNVQVLQKSGTGDFGSRGRRFSGGSGNFEHGPLNGFISDRNRDKDQPGRREAPLTSPRFQRDHQPPPRAVDGRRGSMGPPPVPPHAAPKHTQEGGRQLPPHLSHVSPNISSRPLPRDSRGTPSEPPLSAGLQPSSGRFPPPSPAHSHASLTIVSPAAAANISLPLATPADMDLVRKDVMHIAAERAKQRRQQEEEEREAQKERARRKAAEIEEKIKAEESEKLKEKDDFDAAKIAKDAVRIIEEAVKSVEISSKPAEDKLSEAALGKHPLGRPPSLKGVPSMAPSESLRSAGPRRAGTVLPRPTPLSPSSISAVSQPESWRARMSALPSPAPRQIQARQTPASANFIASGPSAAEQVETIADGSQEDLEVVDFSDMGKFVGVPEGPEEAHKAPASAAGTDILSKPSRPVASDFFDEPASVGDTLPASKKADFGVWRRKVSQDSNEPSVPLNDAKQEVAIEMKKTATSAQDHTILLKEHSAVLETFVAAETSMASTQEPLTHLDQQQQRGAQNDHISPSSNVQRTSRPLHKEPTMSMSALDDAMSRIKGVLSGMQAQEPPKDVTQTYVELESRTTLSVHFPQHTHVQSSTKDRWVPPALRPRRFDDNDEPREVFLVTILQPPSSPSPTAGSIPVCLPSISHPVDFIFKKQLQAFFRPPFQARMDILSFEPAIPDMNRRDLSLNDVLFRRPPPGFKGRFKYRVLLPRSRGPKVNIPSAVLTKPGAFGRPTPADGASTWRKPLTTTTGKVEEMVAEVTSLDTMSRSPPPNHTPPETTVASIPKTREASPAKLDGGQAARSRSQPKMPVGSAVAFIRDSRIDVVEADSKPLVNFIIGSQLEDSTQGSQVTGSDISKTSPGIEPSFLNQDGKGDHSSRHLNGTALTSSTSSDDKEAAPFNAESKGSDDSTDGIIVTPPTHHSTPSWTRSSTNLPVKESPARGPDPEHLKAVWSQTSNKAGLHPVNSLEGIADDLTGLPFTLQDVKSEDGETPPPSLPSAPSRMSLHEVTRAFQQVPTPSSAPIAPPHRASFSPPSTQAPVARPLTAYAYSPVPQNNMRPAYVPYPPQMMSHSPGPMVYGHPMASSPVPSRMQVNGHTPLYSQPMWTTMPGPSPQGHGNMMRPVSSPYPAQMMSYPSAGYAPQPPQAMMPTTPQGQNGGRGRAIPVMSPVMSHAHAHPVSAMYNGSPVMLHAVQVPQNHGYISIPAGRGQPRPENGQMPNPQQQHPLHSGHHPNAPASFARPAW